MSMEEMVVFAILGYKWEKQPSCVLANRDLAFTRLAPGRYYFRLSPDPLVIYR